MEELQDAIEDAQYVNAIATQDDGPRPVLPWEIPYEEQLAEWEERVKSRGENNDPSERKGKPFTFEWYLSSAVGLFQFSAFLKEDKKDYVRINFVEEVLRYRKLRGRQREEKARFILSTYLQTPPAKFESEEPELPKKSEIDEFDLDRKPPNLNLTGEQFQALCKNSMDPENIFCCIGIKGQVRDELITKLKDALEKSELIQKAESVPVISKDLASGQTTPPHSRSEPLEAPEAISSESMRILTRRLRSDGASDVPSNIFDEAEAVVMECLRKEYWDSFLDSQWFTRLRNFLWYQDRRVVPEDFFVMRVLGRGGFGLVTGKLLVILR